MLPARLWPPRAFSRSRRERPARIRWDGGLDLVGRFDLGGKTNPNQPKKLVEGAGDFTKKDGSASNGLPQTKANETHWAFAWEQRTASGARTGKDYVVLVDDLEELDDGNTRFLGLGCDVQAHRHGRLRDAGLDAGVVGDDAGIVSAP